MPHIIDIIDRPAKIQSCTCEQCRATKGKRKNRKAKKYFKRLLNKRRRNPQNEGKVINHYWA